MKDTDYVLFTTHPLREMESNFSVNTYTYLTFYAFNSDPSKPMNIQGATAEEVYKLISLLEDDALRTASICLENKVFKAAKEASHKLVHWLVSSIKLGGLTNKTYFLPIPVALVAIVP